MAKYRLGDVRPNPFRDMARYQLRPEKVEVLRSSIKSTGFWDNVVAREREKGKPELAYGHHRLEALRAEYGDDHQVTLITKNLDDATMLRMMANENMEEWSHSFAVTLETVRAVLAASAEGKIELPPVPANTNARLIRKLRGAAQLQYTASTLAQFLDWDKDRVNECLRAIDASEDKIIDESDLSDIPPATATEIINQARVTQKQTGSKAVARKQTKVLADKVRSKEASSKSIRAETRKLRAQDKNGNQQDMNIWADRLVMKMGAFLFDDELGEGLSIMVEHLDRLDEDTKIRLAANLRLLSERALAFASQLEAFAPELNEGDIEDAEFTELVEIEEVSRA